MSYSGENLIYSHVVGYMLKIIKNRVVLNKKTKNYFNYIKHSNFQGFIDLIKEPVPPMVIWSNGEIIVSPEKIGNQCDFIGLLASGPSLKTFYQKCLSEVGDFNDIDFDDEIYKKLALFELAIRMHLNNNSLILENETIVNFIPKLQQICLVTNDEIKTLIKANQFLNKIKHPEKLKNDKWKSDVVVFDEAFSILVKYNITVN